MSPATWQALSITGALADLSSHVRLRLSGPDAIRYLNGQVTNDVRKLQSGTALPACVTNHKGKLEAWVHLTQAPDGALHLSAPADLQDFLPLRLEKYLIADDCVLEDVTGATTLLHLIAPLEKISPWLAEGERPAAVSRFGPPGYDLWSTPERLAHWQKHFPTLTPEDLSALEVLHAVPAWGVELTPDLLPPEAGLDRTAIDYHKGCYIGQEVISRIRSVGRVNRHLAHLLQVEGPPVAAGDALHSSPAMETAPGSAPAGHLTRTAFHPLTGQHHALAYLRRGTTGPLHCGPDPAHPLAILHIQKTLDD